MCHPRRARRIVGGIISQAPAIGGDKTLLASTGTNAETQRPAASDRVRGALHHVRLLGKAGPSFVYIALVGDKT
jgi:hypothetical protein